jgi:hypothetical protein
MKKTAVDKAGYGIAKGAVNEITLPNEKYIYLEIDSPESISAQKRKWDCKTVQYSGCCCGTNIDINRKAHWNFPIEINGVSVDTFLPKILEYHEACMVLKELKNS